MSAMRKVIDWDWLETYREEIERLDMPRCAKCGKRLHIGDQVDANWPWFDDYNMCRKCEAGKGGALHAGKTA